ncbi:Histone-lysine N-methyltransferase EHMT1 [Araneus ventricosus]|uniref:Histone-lysine N-methyltransferase EHMT1 n=1 Tax=Araneus ventricosus TaxID=182803 RepID=A0A4Y2EZ87_ARAVE|nr:Histone-lysine N-methyltransferase EHMT1 [Araneus ventricosus]
MQKQNIWTDSYSSSGHSEKGWNTSDNPDSDEVDNSYIKNSASQPDGHINESFTYCDADNISTNSDHNMTSVTDSSTVSSGSTGTGIVGKNKYGGMFSNSSSFIESEHSSLLSCKYSDETHINQINGQLQSEAVPSSELSSKQDETVSSLSSVQRCSKRRNSLPSDYPNYKRRLSVDYEVQSLCGLDGSDSNSSCDMNRHYGNEESSWTNCYAPYRKHPTSVVSLERGAESLIDKLFSEEQKKRYEALRKKSAKRMDSKRRKDKHVNFGTVYKSFVEGITHSSQNLSVFTKTDISFQKGKKDDMVNKTDTKMLESISDGCTIRGVSVDIDYKDSHQIMFTADSIPEETDTDLKSESGNLSVDVVSYQQDTVPMDFDAIDDGLTSDNVLVQNSSSDGCAVHKVCTDVNDNSKDSHKVVSAADSIPEETDADLVSESDSLSVNVVSNQQDAMPLDCDVVDDGHTSENVLVLNSSDDCAINKVSADTNDDSNDSQQLIFITDTMPEKNNAEIKSQPDYLAVHTRSIQQDAVSVSCDADRFTSENPVSPAKVSADTDDNSQEVILVADSMPKETESNIISESAPLSDHVNLHEQDVLADFRANGHTSEHVLVTDVSSDIVSEETSINSSIDISNIDNNFKESQNVTFITGSFHDEMNVISKSDHVTAHTNSNQEVVMSADCVTNEITSENVLVPVVSSDAGDNSEDSQQVIFITDSIPKETHAEIMLESDCLASHTNSNEQHILTIDSDVDQTASEDMLVYVACSDGYRLCKVSTNPDINSQDSQQVTFITESLPNETDGDLIAGSNCYIINSDSSQQDAVSVSYTTGSEDPTSEGVLVPVSEVLFKTVPFEGTHQNIDLKVETNETQFYDPMVDKGDTNSSAGNLTTDEISDSLDKIFTQTTESDVLYSIPEEQREVPFDFDGEKLISLSANISNEAAEDTYTVIPEASEENAMHDQLANSSTETHLNSEDKGNISSVEYYLENKSTAHINQEDMVLVEEKQNISVESSDRNQQIESKESINAHIDLCSVNTEKVFEIQPNHLGSTEMEICYEEGKVFGDSENQKIVLYEDVNVAYENLCGQEKKSQISNMDTTTCDNDKNNEIGQLLSHFKSTNEICHNILEETSDSSLKRLHMNELALVNMTESSNMLFHTGIKGKAFSNEQLGEGIENSKTETSDFKYRNNNLSMESCVKSQNSSYKCRTSKARKSTSKSSILKPSENEVLKFIENTIDNEAFNLMESEENLSSHDSPFVAQEQVPQNLPTLTYTLSDSEAENIPLIESDINFNPDLEMKSLQKSKSSFKAHFNGKHKNGTAKKSFSQISNKSSDDMSNNCDKQNSVASSGSESDDISSECRKTARYLSDYNRTEINNPTTSCTIVEDLSVLHNNLENATQRTALKTFKKPFTVAKKSVTEKSSFKTVFQSYFGIRTAKKTYNKSSNKKLLNTNLDESSSSVEELSADEAKNSTVIWSPVKDLQLKVCRCSAVEVPCLCNGEELQSICEAEDTVDEKIVPCTKSISQQYLLTPSSEIKHRAFCDIHLWRLKKHHCCPKCGIFCTQGSFLCCSYDHPVKGAKETHFFHPSCFLVPDTGLPPGCPHCCTFSNFKNVHFSLTEEVPEETLTQSPNKCTEELNITEGLENYSILMKTQNVESETISRVCTTSIPPTQDLKTMLMAITKEPTLRLRPTGKCLFNPIKVGDVKKVIQLIANGVDPNHKFNQHKNNTPLHIAAFYGSIGIVHILIQYGASIDAVNDDLETPFILAVEKDQMAVVRYLIHAGAEIDVKNENGLTAFHVACKNNSKEMAEFLYNSGKFDINLQDDGGWTPLVWACEHNYGDLVQWLLKHGADPNVRDNEQNTALHWAACSGNSEILEMLLDTGCNLCFVNQRGDSALHIAARKDNWACVKLLLARNASLDCANKDGETPIMCCDEDSKSLRILNKHSLTSTISDYKSFQQYVVYRDISRGSEKYPIQAVNEVDQEEFIMDFRYITRNCYASNVTIISTVDSMQKCYCKDNCSSDCTCTRISKCWYDMDGCLLSDFDMYDPPSLYECNKTCHCPKTCINRVVQKGLSYPLQLFRTLNRGWGVRTLKDLARGTFVCEYVGEVISEDEINRRTDDTYLFDLESKTGDNCIDGRFYGNIARFINHSCEPNLVSIRVFIEHQDLNFPRIAFFTMKDITAFEELCFDYGTEFWVAKSQYVLCTCNSSLCKYSKDSIDATLQAYINEKEEQALSSMDVQLS